MTTGEDMRTMFLENNQVKHYPIYVIGSWVAVVAWMGLIFFFSHQPATQSSALSSVLAQNLLALIGQGGNTALIEAFNNGLRMFAHGSLFFVLALLVGTAFRMVNVTDLGNAIVTLAFCLVYAATDEWHQSVVPGRASQWIDFFIDGGGALLAIIIQQVVWMVRRVNAELAVDR